MGQSLFKQNVADFAFEYLNKPESTWKLFETENSGAVIITTWRHVNYYMKSLVPTEYVLVLTVYVGNKDSVDVFYGPYNEYTYDQGNQSIVEEITDIGQFMQFVKDPNKFDWDEYAHGHYWKHWFHNIFRRPTGSEIKTYTTQTLVPPTPMKFAVESLKEKIHLSDDPKKARELMNVFVGEVLNHKVDHWIQNFFIEEVSSGKYEVSDGVHTRLYSLNSSPKRGGIGRTYFLEATQSKMGPHPVLKQLHSHAK